MEDLYDGTSLRSFSALQEKFWLPLMDHFQYTQIVHLLKPLPSKQRAIPSRVMTMLAAHRQLPIKGSRIYFNLFTQNKFVCKTSNINKWGTDLGKQFSPLQWHKAISWAHKSSTCANHKEQYHKLLMTWYVTPHMTCQIFPYSVSILLAILWLNGFYLISWSCPRLR